MKTSVRTPRWYKSSKRRIPYSGSTTTSARPRSRRIESSSSRPKYFELMEDSKMVIANPTAIAERKKKTGSNGLYQNGRSLLGMIRYSVPSDDWCNVESSTPRMTNTTMTRRMIRNGFCRLKCSNTIGENSMASTAVYNITQEATSNSTECGLRMTSGCQMFEGNPRSYISAAQTSRYPRKAVRMVGRTMECSRLMLKISTAAVSVNPPAANMTPHMTSKPIHRPQGN